MPRLRFVLIGSVLLNLFLAGALIAGAIWLRGGGSMIGAGSLRIAGSELPAAERRPFRLALRDARRSVRPIALESRAAKAQAATLLRQPVVDQGAVLAALARARNADLAVRAAVEQRAVAYVATLPAADRARVADAMAKRAEKGNGVSR